MEDIADSNHSTGRHEMAAAQAEAPAMPSIPPGTLWRDSASLLDENLRSTQRYTIGWQDTRKAGPCFAVVRLGAMASTKVLDRFPLTEDGWSQAWAALVELDASAAKAVLDVIEKRAAARAAQMAETERQARLYETFVRGGTVTTFRTLGVQVLAADDNVYTIGRHDAATKTNASRLLGPLVGAQAMVTDGAQAWSPGRAMFLPLSFTGLATKTKADAAVVFPPARSIQRR